MKKILFAASESVPFIKTGGLADVVGSLPKWFDKKEYDVRVIIPKYMCIDEKWKSKMQYVDHFYMDLCWRRQYVGILQMELDGVTYYFIDNEYYFSGPKPYGDVRYDLENLHFSQEQYCQHFLLLDLDLILYIVMTGIQDLYLYISKIVLRIASSIKALSQL